ncbi:MAG: DUF6614 family protein, partial [Candidatus Competibacter sp.]
SRPSLGYGYPLKENWYEFDDLAQMQVAFDAVSSRTDPVESLHHAVNSKAQDVVFALYRDFPDATRMHGQERF